MYAYRCHCVKSPLSGLCHCNEIVILLVAIETCVGHGLNCEQFAQSVSEWAVAGKEARLTYELNILMFLQK